MGTTLLGWAIRQTLCCPSVAELWVGSDCEEYLGVASKAGVAGKTIVCVRRKPVQDEQTNFDGVSEVLLDSSGRRRDASTARILQVQLTSPFINPSDLQKLAELDDADPAIGFALSADMQSPSGQGYLIHPGVLPNRWEFVQQTADPCDIDTLADYVYAVSRVPIQPTYGR